MCAAINPRLIMVTVKEHEGSRTRQQALRLFGMGLSREREEGEEAWLSFPIRGDMALYTLVYGGGGNIEGGAMCLVAHACNSFVQSASDGKLQGRLKGRSEGVWLLDENVLVPPGAGSGRYLTDSFQTKTWECLAALLPQSRDRTDRVTYRNGGHVTEPRFRVEPSLVCYGQAQSIESLILDLRIF